MREIPLTRGAVAIVDDEDFDRVSAHKWSLRGCSPYAYAGRRLKRTEGQPKGGNLEISMHEEIKGVIAGFVVDHRNGNGLDNRRDNLRHATHSQNMQNTRKQMRQVSSRFKGVSYVKREGRWSVYISVANKNRFVGYFATEMDAARAYDAAAGRHYGAFARLNFQQEQAS